MKIPLINTSTVYLVLELKFAKICLDIFHAILLDINFFGKKVRTNLNWKIMRLNLKITVHLINYRETLQNKPFSKLELNKVNFNLVVFNAK